MGWPFYHGNNKKRRCAIILTDYSAVAIAAIINSAMKEKIALDENVIKHITFSTFRNIHKALSNKYGRHFLLCDSRSWRKDAFEFYKANRKAGKDDESPIDWELIYRVMDEIREAFDVHFPFHVIKAKGCEADDLIAAWAIESKEPTVIVSKDKDFFQLHRANVKQWDFSKKKYIEVPDPAEYRLEHIIRGDAGDGIPNMLSDDDTFVIQGKSQTQMRKKRLDDMIEYARDDFNSAPKEYILRKEMKVKGEIVPALIRNDLKRNWERNKLLIDLTDPVEPAVQSINKYLTQERKTITQNDTANYLANQKMIVLFGKVGDFFSGDEKKGKESGPLSNFM